MLAQIKKTLVDYDGSGLFGFVAKVEAASLQKSRVTGVATPQEWDKIIKVIKTVVGAGIEYKKAINVRKEKEGSTPNFTPKETYCVPISENLLVYKHKENEQMYLRVYPNLCGTYKSNVWYFKTNGTQITLEQYKEWLAEYGKDFTKTVKKNESQGLDKPLEVKNYKLENILWLKRGEILIDELTPEIKGLIKQVCKW